MLAELPTSRDENAPGYCGETIWCYTSGRQKYAYYSKQRSSRTDVVCPANGRSIPRSHIGGQIDRLMGSMFLLPSWKQRVIAQLAGPSEQDEVLRKRKKAEGRLKRLAQTYIDGLIDKGQYEIQKETLQDRKALEKKDKVVIFDPNEELDKGHPQFGCGGDGGGWNSPRTAISESSWS
ncbi:MAG: hypothetical protein V3U79_09830 [Dehalococcoidia bacterium]